MSHTVLTQPYATCSGIYQSHVVSSLS